MKSQPLYLMKVPCLYSSKAIRSSSRVFITIGPCHATGSPMGLPEIRLGLVAAAGTTYRLPRLVGFGKAWNSASSEISLQAKKPLILD